MYVCMFQQWDFIIYNEHVLNSISQFYRERFVETISEKLGLIYELFHMGMVEKIILRPIQFISGKLRFVTYFFNGIS